MSETTTTATTTEVSAPAIAAPSAEPTTETVPNTDTQPIEGASVETAAAEEDSGAGGTIDAPKIDQAAVELSELHTLAKELGITIQPEPNNRERTARRTKQKKERESLRAYVADQQSRIDRALADHQPLLNAAETVISIVDADEINFGHLDKFSQAFGHSNWGAMIEAFEAWRADPGTRATEAMESRLQGIEQQKAREEQQRRQHEQAAQVAQQQEQHFNLIRGAVAQSKDDLCSDLSGFVPFTKSIAAAHREQGFSDTTLEALLDSPVAMLNGQTPRDYWTGFRAKLSRAKAAMEAAAAPPKPKAKPKQIGSKSPGKTGIVRGSPVEAAGTGEWTDEKEFTRRFIQEMKAAAERDRAEGRQLGGSK